MQRSDRATFPTDWLEKLNELNLLMANLDVHEVPGRLGDITVWPLGIPGGYLPCTDNPDYTKALVGLQFGDRFVWLDRIGAGMLGLALRLAEDMARMGLPPGELKRRGLARLSPRSKDARSYLDDWQR